MASANTFLILLGSIGLALALAFGIGGRDVARDILQRAYGRAGEVAPRGGSAGGAPRGTTTGGDDRTTFTPDR